jgi:hypothetical protein
LYENLSLEEAKQKEIESISKYQTSNEDYGYNMTPGGEVYCGEDNPWFGRHHTEESKRKMSQQRKGIKHSEEWNKNISKALKGREFSKETKKRMSQNHSDVSGKNNPNYGKTIPKNQLDKMIKLSKTPEAIAKMKRNKKWYSGAENPNAKKIICLDNGKIYDCIKDAAEDLKCNNSKISDVLHGRRKHTNNYHFEFVEE